MWSVELDTVTVAMTVVFTPSVVTELHIGVKSERFGCFVEGHLCYLQLYAGLTNNIQPQPWISISL